MAVNGEGFAYRIWRLYYVPELLLLGIDFIPNVDREKFLRDYWSLWKSPQVRAFEEEQVNGFVQPPSIPK